MVLISVLLIFAPEKGIWSALYECGRHSLKYNKYPVCRVKCQHQMKESYRILTPFDSARIISQPGVCSNFGVL